MNTFTPTTVEVSTSQTVENSLESQYFRLPLAEQRQFRKILRQAAVLDRALTALHLQLPAIEIRQYLSSPGCIHGFAPAELLRRLARRHARRR